MPQKHSYRLHAHILFLIRSIMRQYCPDRTCYFVGQSHNDNVKWSTLFHPLDPRIEFFRTCQHTSGSVDQQSSQIRVADKLRHLSSGERHAHRTPLARTVFVKILYILRMILTHTTIKVSPIKIF